MAESHVFDEIIDFLNFDLFDGDVIIILSSFVTVAI